MLLLITFGLIFRFLIKQTLPTILDQSEAKTYSRVGYKHHFNGCVTFVSSYDGYTYFILDNSDKYVIYLWGHNNNNTFVWEVQVFIT